MAQDPSKAGAVATLRLILLAFPKDERAELLRLAAICQGCGADYLAILERNKIWWCTCQASPASPLNDKLNQLRRDLATMAAVSRRIEGARLLLKAAGISWWSVAQHFVGNEVSTSLPETLAKQVLEVLDPKPPQETPAAETTP